MLITQGKISMNFIKPTHLKCMPHVNRFKWELCKRCVPRQKTNKHHYVDLNVTHMDQKRKPNTCTTETAKFTTSRPRERFSSKQQRYLHSRLYKCWHCINMVLITHLPFSSHYLQWKYKTGTHLTQTCIVLIVIIKHSHSWQCFMLFNLINTGHDVKCSSKHSNSNYHFLPIDAKLEGCIHFFWWMWEQYIYPCTHC